jgi:hypothetical protein
MRNAVCDYILPEDNVIEWLFDAGINKSLKLLNSKYATYHNRRLAIHNRIVRFFLMIVTSAHMV